MEVLHSGRLGGKNLNRVLHRPLSGMNGQETGVPAAVQIVAQQREVRGVFAPLLRRNKRVSITVQGVPCAADIAEHSPSSCQRGSSSFSEKAR